MYKTALISVEDILSSNNNETLIIGKLDDGTFVGPLYEKDLSPIPISSRILKLNGGGIRGSYSDYRIFSFWDNKNENSIYLACHKDNGETYICNENMSINPCLHIYFIHQLQQLFEIFNIDIKIEKI